MTKLGSLLSSLNLFFFSIIHQNDVQKKTKPCNCRRIPLLPGRSCSICHRAASRVAASRAAASRKDCSSGWPRAAARSRRSPASSRAGRARLPSRGCSACFWNGAERMLGIRAVGVDSDRRLKKNVEYLFFRTRGILNF